MEDPGFSSLLPALVTIALAFATRQVIPALFLGVLTGSIVLFAGSGAWGDLNFIDRFLFPALGSEGFARILLIYLWCLGGLIGIWERTGGARHFADTVGGKLAKSAKGSLVYAWLLGVVFHQGGTVSTVLAGTTARPATDKHKVSHEELAYVVDSTASPAATILPFNAWPGYVAALVAGTVPFIPDVAAGATFFFSSVKFNFYGMLAILGTLLFSLGLMPWVGGRMKAAITRARETGKLDAESAQPMMKFEDKKLEGFESSLWEFLVPLGTLLGLAIIPYVVFDVNAIDEAFMACVLSAMVVARVRGMPTDEVIGAFIEGCKAMTIGALVLALAVTLGTVSKDLNTASYLVSLFQGTLPALVLPAVLTYLCMGVAFATGSSWGTYAVVFPVAMPLAYALHPDPTYVSVCFGAVLGGAVFGDQCSPISDTTILSSMFTGCDLMDHVRTQLPLAFVVATLGAGLSTLAAALA